MSDETDARRGDVVIVQLAPAEGHEKKKTRPAVVVQNDVGNASSSTTVVAPATGTYRGYPFEVLVGSDDSPFEKDSSVRLDQIRVVSIENADSLGRRECRHGHDGEGRRRMEPESRPRPSGTDDPRRSVGGCVVPLARSERHLASAIGLLGGCEADVLVLD